MAKPSKPADYGVEAGTVLLGKYRVDAILGHGGMGVVAQCTHLQLEERVAIKFLRDDVILDEETMRRFLREAQNAVKLKSEHVARVSDVGTFESGTPYMVMEYLEGIDLGQMLEESGKINPSLAVELLIQACVALAEAHSLGIVHRDIKPGNLFVTWRADGSPLLKILDFGISKAPVGADMNLTQTQSLLGTPAYMSPEQMRSARTVDPRSDIWSLGTVLFEIIQGRRPFEAESFSEMCVKVAVDPPSALTVPHPAGLEKVILRALEKRPEDRYQTIAEMARDLVPFARDRNGALVAVERMTRMLGRSRPGFGRDDYSSPEAAPRGMMRDAKSQPIALPRADDGATAPGTGVPQMTPVTPKFDSGVLLVGDATDLIDDLPGEATAITRMDSSDGAGDATRTKVLAIHEDSDDTAERKRRESATSEATEATGHTTIEEDLSWTSGKWGITPQSTTAQPGPTTDRSVATTDPSLPPAQLTAQAKAEVDAAVEAQAQANAAAAAQAHAAAKVLAAQKAKGTQSPALGTPVQPLAPAAAKSVPTRNPGGTIPITPSTLAKPAGTAAAPGPAAIVAAVATEPSAAARSAAAAPATAQAQSIGSTLPGLFPASLPRGALTPPPSGATGSSPMLLTKTGAKAAPVAARRTAPVADLRPGRGKLMLGLALLVGVGIGVAIFIGQRGDDEAAAPAPSELITPPPATGDTTTPPVTGPAPTPQPIAVPAADSGSARTITPPTAPPDLAPTPPPPPPKTNPAPSAPSTHAAATTTKTGRDKTDKGDKKGAKAGKGIKDKTGREGKRAAETHDAPVEATPPKKGDDDVFGKRDPTLHH